MKFNVQSKALGTAVSAVSKVINSKNAMTILNNFLFEVKNGKLTVIGSDLENTLKYSVDIAECEGECTFCVDARRMVDLMKELPDVGISFEVSDQLEIRITYTGGKYQFVGVTGKDYPDTMPDNSEDKRLSVEIPATVALAGIDNTLFAVGIEAVRPQMMGILWDFHYGDITFVASDTHKLVRFVNSNVEPGIECSFILPSKPAVILKSILGKEDKLSVVLTSQNVTFSNGTFVLSSSFIKGEFPAYNKVIPAANPYTLTVDRLQFLNAVKRMVIFGDQAHKLIKFKIEPTELTIKTSDPSFCTQGTEKMPCDFTGEGMVIGFSAQYLTEIFTTLSTENVLVQLADPSRPGVFTPATNEDKCDLVVLLMPMTVNEF